MATKKSTKNFKNNKTGLDECCWYSTWFIFYTFFLLNQFTDSTVPYLDAIVSAFAWAGTWLLLKRKLENWILLNISNLIAIPLQFYKGLELTSLLTMIYVVIAFLGYREWKKKLEMN